MPCGSVTLRGTEAGKTPALTSNTSTRAPLTDASPSAPRIGSISAFAARRDAFSDRSLAMSVRSTCISISALLERSDAFSACSNAFSDRSLAMSVRSVSISAWPVGGSEYVLADGQNGEGGGFGATDPRKSMTVPMPVSLCSHSSAEHFVHPRTLRTALASPSPHLWPSSKRSETSASTLTSSFCGMGHVAMLIFLRLVSLAPGETPAGAAEAVRADAGEVIEHRLACLAIDSRQDTSLDTLCLSPIAGVGACVCGRGRDRRHLYRAFRCGSASVCGGDHRTWGDAMWGPFLSLLCGLPPVWSGCFDDAEEGVFGDPGGRHEPLDVPGDLVAHYGEHALPAVFPHVLPLVRGHVQVEDLRQGEVLSVRVSQGREALFPELVELVKRLLVHGQRLDARA